MLSEPLALYTDDPRKGVSINSNKIFERSAIVSHSFKELLYWTPKSI